MKILRLFITDQLEAIINWVYIDGEDIKNGASSFEELAQFTDVHLEIYLSASCCSILNIKVTGISSRRLTEELVLGLIEESIADDIEEVKPIVLRESEDIAYVAIFNRDYYEMLIRHLSALQKPIRFVQSFVYSTLENENGWTLFLNEDQKFLRTSKYQYFLLDDNKPLPSLLEDMILTEKPASILVYTDEEDTIKELSKLNTEIKLVENAPNFGELNWNFYNQKSTRFNIKIDDAAKGSIFKLLRTAKYAAIILVVAWVVNILILVVNNYKIESLLKSELKNVVKVDNINQNLLQLAANKITSMRHDRGIYDLQDVVPLFEIFLEVVSDISTDDITQINYDRNTLQVFLSDEFDDSQFSSYQNILATKGIELTLQDYKSYAKQLEKAQDSNANPDIKIMRQPEISSDTAWVVTLKPAFINKKAGG